ncbi:hypothetical protein [Hyphomonas sp.]|uniref:hypothetical protein n=1 Tax=Hyphomonas sp. TaxID=87 RepID=UPI0039187CD0
MMLVNPPKGWRPFSDDSPWNTPIPEGAAIDRNSDVLVESLALDGGLYVNIPEWTVSVRFFDSSRAPRKPVRPLYAGRYGPGFEPDKRVPLPDGAVPDDDSGATSYYVTLVDPYRNKAWDIRQGGQTARGDWYAGFGAEIDLSGRGVAVPWMQAPRADLSGGARPSGIPLSAGLIRRDHVKAGHIPHALAFAYRGARPGWFIPPASTALEGSPDRAGRQFGLPMGARIQLDPDYDIDNTRLSDAGKVIARALQEYGAILVDEAGATVLFAEGGPEHAPEWEGVLDPGELQFFFTPDFMREHFRVLEMEERMPGQVLPRAS